MAEPIQGLRISLKFGDVLDREQILENLNLPLRDLEKIRDIQAEGVTQEDLITTSGIDIDIEKNAIGIWSEMNSYENILKNLNNSRTTIGQNITINGKLVSPSFKFKTVDYTDSNQIKTIDLSTSRASAWSAFGDPTQSIFYGGDLQITDSNSIEVGSLEFADEIIEKEFESQIATHKIRINVDGVDYDLYAMKGIPLTFRGFFGSVAEMKMNYNVLSGGQRPSWAIENIDNNLRYVYENITSGTATNRSSTISFSDTKALNREVKIYYPVENITLLELKKMNIFEMPDVTLPNLSSLNISFNDILEMPNLALFAPSLATLDISNNNLGRTDNTNLANFNQNVVQRLPDSLITLTINNTYENDCVVDFGAIDGLPNLRNFYANSGGGGNRKMTGTAPAINNVMTTYQISSNRFTEIDNSVLNTSSIENLNIRNNGEFSTTIDFPNATNLKIFFTGNGNKHNIINLSGKEELITYYTDYMSFINDTDGSNIISGCTKLDYFRINNTNVSGTLPNLNTNTALRYFVSWSTQWEDADVNYSISDTTFGTSSTSGCRKTLAYFNLGSPYLSNPIHENALVGMTALVTFSLTSYGNGITGTLPYIGDCFNLGYFYMNKNNLSGEIPTINANQKLIRFDISNNYFTGIFPYTILPNIRDIYVYNNQIEGFAGLVTPFLYTINANNNNITELPDFTNALKLRYIYFSNNNISSYNIGTIANLKDLTKLDLSGNNLTTGDIDNIIYDLNTNYDTNPSRRNVIVNLNGNAPSSGTEDISAIISKLISAGWSIGLA